ncbi:MAG: hypothetical protein JWP89_3863 [Schlesneria sp.]|nr:hypothetical protein [Schlesneria sp.]
MVASAFLPVGNSRHHTMAWVPRSWSLRQGRVFEETQPQFILVPKLQLGNAGLRSSASRSVLIDVQHQHRLYAGDPNMTRSQYKIFETVYPFLAYRALVRMTGWETRPTRAHPTSLWRPVSRKPLSLTHASTRHALVRHLAIKLFTFEQHKEIPQSRQ